ncbi:MAG: hypothetical protein DRN66_03165 [Candidatus Nanohalarchaeota archaeon]|nr:MAG: hypothetical protein DRN66_03165 [Candidatus Nanohaloarchaeota archaeon]
MYFGRKLQAKLQLNAIASAFVIAFVFLPVFSGICSLGRQNKDAFASGITLLQNCASIGSDSSCNHLFPCFSSQANIIPCSGVIGKFTKGGAKQE